jgi:preprotein translocase subunit SecE
MAKEQGVNLSTAGASRPTRAPAKTAAVSQTTAPPAAPKPRTSPAQFYREVRVEVRKISWPAWKETWVTSVMVMIMVTVAAIFLSITDGALTFLVQQILKLGG